MKTTTNIFMSVQLEVDGLKTGYGTLEIIHGESFEVDPDSMVAVIGPNGAGKSTMIKSVVGVNDAWEGRIEFKGTDVTDLRIDERIEKGIGYVPQDENVFPSMTVRENLEVGAYLDRDNYEQNAERVFDIFPDLEDRQTATAGALSGGQQQMLALGRALMIDPEFLVLDEPTAGVAPHLIEDLMGWIERIQEKLDLSVLMVEQNVREALEIVDEAIILIDGKIDQRRDADELLNKDDLGELFIK
jgi:ABC-type branched-subunit amino acid transport system ATPase component